MKFTKSNKLHRRSFLKGAAVASVALGSGAVKADHDSEQIDTHKANQSQGYRESQHVKQYYRLARF